MMYKLKVRLIVFLAACLCLLFCFVPNSNASQRGFTVQPEIVQFFLSIVGLETQIVDLDREDGFDRALYVENLGNDPILIGFPETGIGEGVPFLLDLEGEEIILQMDEDSGLQIVEGNQEDPPSGIDELTGCIQFTINFLIGMTLMAGFSSLLHPVIVLSIFLNQIILCVLRFLDTLPPL